MKLSESLEKKLCLQIQHELNVSYTYLGMSTWFESNAFEGFARWMGLQSKEEMDHAMKIFHYIPERGGKVELYPLEKPSCSYKSPLEVFENALRLECETTQNIYNLYNAAKDENDLGTQEFLHWFIKEQVEEESSAELMLDKIKLADSNVIALLQLDAQAKMRAE